MRCAKNNLQTSESSTEPANSGPGKNGQSFWKSPCPVADHTANVTGTENPLNVAGVQINRSKGPKNATEYVSGRMRKASSKKLRWASHTVGNSRLLRVKSDKANRAVGSRHPRSYGELYWNTVAQPHPPPLHWAPKPQNPLWFQLLHTNPKPLPKFGNGCAHEWAPLLTAKDIYW